MIELKRTSDNPVHIDSIEFRLDLPEEIYVEAAVCYLLDSSTDCGPFEDWAERWIGGMRDYDSAKDASRLFTKDEHKRCAYAVMSAKDNRKKHPPTTDCAMDAQTYAIWAMGTAGITPKEFAFAIAQAILDEPGYWEEDNGRPE
jgi:hypothetical protein